MGTMRKLDFIAITASSAAADKLRVFMQGLREDTAAAIAGDTSIFHKGEDDEAVERNDDSSDLATALVLVNSMRTKLIAHLASTGLQGAHLAASAEVITEPVATTLVEAQDLANEMKGAYNTHLSEAGVHLNDDSTNVVASADATDQASLDTLLNEMKADYNAHVVSAMAAGYIES